MISVSGVYRVVSLYPSEKVVYATLKDKQQGSMVKIAVPNPAPPALVDDGLISLEGTLDTRIYQNNVTLSFRGLVKSADDLPAVKK